MTNINELLPIKKVQLNDNLNQASDTLKTQCIYSPLLNK